MEMKSVVSLGIWDKSKISGLVEVEVEITVQDAISQLHDSIKCSPLLRTAI